VRGPAIISALDEARGNTPHRRVAAKAGLFALAMLLPVRSVDQLLYAAAFALAFLAFWLWGQALGRNVLGLTRLRFFTAVYLGQLAALAAANVATAAGAASAHLFGVAPPLTFLVVASSLFLLSRELRARRALPAPAERYDLLTPFGIACVAVVVAIYSRHLSALGLDTHEHTAWVEQILQRGYVPMTEPGTNIVADYPRTFHLLTALWTAAGLGLPSGVFVKMMPFLQNALPMLAVGELLEEAAVRRSGEGTRARWQVVLGLGFFVYSILLVPLAYPGPDLLGTPRYSSAAILFAPVVLVLLGAVYRAPGATAAWAVTPLFGAWALTVNPVVPLLLVTVTVPVSAVLYIVLRPPLAGVDRSRMARVAAVAAALGLLVVAQDPWVVGQAAIRSARAVALLRSRGLVTFDEAVRQGLATPREKSVHELPASPPCHDRACVELLAWGAVRSALALPARAAAAAVEDARAVAARPSLPVLLHAFERSLPLQPAAFADYAALPFLAFVAAGALLALARAIRRRRAAGAAQAGFSPERFLAVALVACALTGICLALAGGLGAAFDDHTHDFRVLDVYLNQAPSHVSLALFWIPFAGACLVLAAPRHTGVAMETAGLRAPPLLRAAALALWIALPLSGRLNLHVPIRQEGFWSPIHLTDLRALREVERAVPPEDAVLVPAAHWNVADWENWVIPLGPTTALLPYGERRYLFDVYLGASYPLSWRDLEDRLCSRDPAVRQAFLAKHRVRWLLVRDTRDAETALREQKMCDAPLSALGVQLPPVRSERGLRLFRIEDVPPPPRVSPP